MSLLGLCPNNSPSPLFSFSNFHFRLPVPRLYNHCCLKGAKGPVFTAQLGYKSDRQSEFQPKDLMAGEKEISGINRNPYPPIEPYSTGFLKVSDLHTIYWEQSGNPTGHPVVFLHGGPGGGTAPGNRRFFDPDFYRIILFDQRGAGKSTPHACLEDNTTWNLIDDIEKLREHLEIPEWQVFGGSWGSTLALAYSQSHPEKVTGLVLRGIFLLRKKEIDWFYEGGAAAIYPDAWESFRDLIPESERGCFVDAYSKRLNSKDMETQVSMPQLHRMSDYAAARAWTKWEMMTAHLLPNEENIKRGEDDNFSLEDSGFSQAMAQPPYFENLFEISFLHYLKKLGARPSPIPSGKIKELVDNIDKIRHINAVIVQGRYDVCCPMMSAWDLHKVWPEAELKIISDAGHSANEPGIAAELVAANEKLKNILQKNGP
uniref:Proline iminopeptidase n=1 Tax=Cucumis melo TaxID=3656 RepID=A0A9I9DHI4_CUCME